MKNVVARGRTALVERLTRRPPPIDSLSVLGAVPIPMVLLDQNNGFRYANQAAEQFLGMSMLQLAQIQLDALLPLDNPLFHIIAQVRSTETTISDHDLNFESPRLQKRHISVYVTSLVEEPGCVLLTLQDVSAARALDRQIAYRGAARSVSGMAAILAHEVKNPLSGIRGAAQLLEPNVLPQDRELTDLIRDEVDRIRDLVDRMEVFGEKPVDRRPVNIHRVLEHVRRLAQSGVASGVRISETYDPSLPPVWGNRDQLVQVLFNLVKNAAEAIDGTPNGRERAEIGLTTAYQHGMRLAIAGSSQRVHLPLVVTVRDNGPGISDDIRPHLFEAFVTSKS
ncbi:MAG: PAS domain-containing protein, partial [Sphingomonas sp.]